MDLTLIPLTIWLSKLLSSSGKIQIQLSRRKLSKSFLSENPCMRIQKKKARLLPKEKHSQKLQRVNQKRAMQLKEVLLSLNKNQLFLERTQCSGDLVLFKQVTMKMLSQRLARSMRSLILRKTSEYVVKKSNNASLMELKSLINCMLICM